MTQTQETVDTAEHSLRIKPTQMALMTLGYSHDMIVSGEDTHLRVELPNVDVIFRFDPVTVSIEAVLTWQGRIPPTEANDSLHYLSQINRQVLEPQFSLVGKEGDHFLLQGRVFLFTGAGVTWEQTAEFVHYCLNDAVQVFLDVCAEVWPDSAPVEQPLVPPERSEVEFEFGDEAVAEGNPYGLLAEETPGVTLDRVHELLTQVGADNLHLSAGEYVEFTLMGQRVSTSLTDGRDGRPRQTLVVSSGSGAQVTTQEQLDRLFFLCNDTTRAHMMATVFAEEIEDGARWGVFAESRLDLPAGLTDEQLAVLLLNTSRWNAELCLTIAMKV